MILDKKYIPIEQREMEAIQRQRAEWRKPVDPLAKRARSIALWRTSVWRHYEPMCAPFYRHPGFTGYLMPKLAQAITTKRRARQPALADARRPKVAPAPQQELFA